MGYKDPQKQREYQRNWIAKRRQQGIDLLGGKCELCSSCENLEVDHVDPATKSPILKALGTGCFWSWSWSRIKEELQKCRVLCTECHAAKTAREDQERVQGIRNPNARLAEDDVRLIRISDRTNRDLGAEYGITPDTVGRIKRRERWKHLA